MNKVVVISFMVFCITFLQSQQIFSQNCATVTPSFSYSLYNNGCGDSDTIYFTNTSTGDSATSARYYWLIDGVPFDTTHGTTAPVSLGKSAASYMVKMVVRTPSICWDTVTQTILITPRPEPGIVLISDSVCLGSRVYFSSDNQKTIESARYNWNFGDGNRNNNHYDSASHTYASAGTYTVRLRIINQSGCAKNTTKDITVLSGGQQLRFYDDNGQASGAVTWSRCVNLISQPDSFSQVFASPDTIFNYTAYFGDGDSVSGDTLLPYPNGFLQHTYLETGVFDFIVISRNAAGCENVFIGKVINLRVPTVGVGGPQNGVQSGCVPMTTSFYNSSSNVSGNTTFTWDYGDGTTEEFDTSNVNDSVYHSYYTSVCDIYITLTASNECGSTQSTWGPINAYTTDIANINGPSVLCYPDTSAVLSVASNLNCYSGVRHYYWDFGDGVNTGWSTFPLPQSHNFPDTGTYEVVLIDSNICGVDSATLDLTIYMPPVADFTADTVCLGDSTSFMNQSSIPAGNGDITSYTWNFGDGSTSTEENPKHKYNSYGSFHVTLTVESEHGCFDVYSDNIYVKETPSLSIGASPDFYICDSNTIDFTGNISINTSSITSMSWTFGDGNTATTQNPSNTYLNNGTYKVKFYATAANLCQAVDSTNVYIYSSPQADFTSDSICYGDATRFTDNSSTVNGENIVSWKWDFNSDGTIDNTNENPTHNFPSFGIYDITLIVTTEYGCFDTVIQTSNVYQNPVVNFSMSNNNLCQYDSTRFSNSSTVSDSFVWSFGDGDYHYTTSTADLWHKYSSPGNYYAKLTAYNGHGCMEADSSLITIKPSPSVNFFVSDVDGCEPLDVSFSNTTTNADSYNWDFGNGQNSTSKNTSVTYNTQNFRDTIYTVQLIAEKSGCYDTMEKNISVYHRAEADYTLAPDSGCSPLTVNATNLSNGADSFYWYCTSGDTSTATNPVFDFGNYQFKDIVYDLTLTATTIHGCEDTAMSKIKVKPAPFALFTSDKIQGCEPLTINFTDYSIIADNYLWDFGDGNTSTQVDPSHTFYGGISDTTYTVKLIVSSDNGCVDSFSKDINVYSEVIAYFNNSDTACIPFNVQFVDSSTNADYYKWDFGDGNSSTARSPTHSYTKAGIYSVSLAISSQSGCTDTLLLPNIIKANQVPDADFSVSSNAGCEPFPVNFTNLSSQADSFHWKFGDGSESRLSFANYTYRTPGGDTTYTATLIASTNEGCVDSIQKNISVYSEAIAYFNQGDTACIPFNVKFKDSSINVDNWYWDFGDGNSSNVQNPTNIYSSAGTYSVTLSVSNSSGCTDTLTLNNIIKANQVPTAKFSTQKSSGCEPLLINFTNLSSDADHFYWKFGDQDTSTQQFTNHIYRTPFGDTSYTARLITTTYEGCVDSTEKTISVYSEAIAYFNQSDTACIPFNMKFMDSSTNASSWSWDFGNGSSSNLRNPTTTYDIAGTYSVTLAVENNAGCRDTLTLNNIIKANQMPTAKFSTQTSSGCEPLFVSFNNQTSQSDSFLWRFGDGDTSTNQLVNHIFRTPYNDTTFTTTLITYTNEGCVDSTQRQITVFSEAIAYFNQSDTACIPFNVSFKDSSTNANAWTWDFGDGSSSSSRSPNHVYTNPGQYTVTLAVANNSGCTDTLELKNIIKANQNPTAKFNIQKSTGCEPLLVQFTNQSSYADSVIWDFGDGDTSTQYFSTHSYTTPFQDTGYTSKLTVFTREGCKDSFTRPISVYKGVNAYFNDTMTDCTPVQVQFTDSSSFSNFWLWEFGDGNSSTVRDPSHTYSTPGTYSVTLIASNFRCSDTFTFKNNIEALPVPTAFFTTDVNSGCEPLDVNFSNQTFLGDSIFWDFADGSTSLLNDPSHSFTTPFNDTIYNVKLTALTKDGCMDSFVRPVNVFKAVTAFFNDQDSGCAPLATKFYDQSSFAKYYLWDFGDGNTSTSENPDYIYRNPGTYTVKLIASNYRCSDTFIRQNNINVWENPVALFSTSGINGCEPLTIDFNNLSHLANSYHWNFGDGKTSGNADPSHIFETTHGSDTVYNAQLIVSTLKGCRDTFQKDITVYKSVDANFTEADSGCAPVTVSFNDRSSHAMFWLWEFGDGSASTVQNPTYTYYNPGVYSVRLIASNNHCSDTFSMKDNITVWEVPVSRFTSTQDTVIYPNTTFEFISLSKQGLYHDWDFGDGGNSTQVNPVYAYSDTGYYQVALIVSTDHCLDTSFRTVQVVPPLPSPDFSFQPNNGCVPLTVYFQDESEFATSYIWSFGDGQTSTEQNPVYTYKVPGVYTVTLITSNAIGTTNISKKDVITAHPQPATYFDVAPEVAYLPDAKIRLINRTVGAVAYEWYIDEAFITNDTNPELTYNFPGRHDVKLISISKHGCKDTLVRFNIIRIDSSGAVVVPTAFTPGNEDGKNDRFRPLMEGYAKDEYRFVIFNRWGELLFETTDPNESWDGTFKGRLCEDEIYYWIVTVKLHSEGKKKFDGKVQLLR